jgi:hypothetical protein
MFGDVYRFIVPHLISKIYFIISGIRTYLLVYQNDIQFTVNKQYIYPRNIYSFCFESMNITNKNTYKNLAFPLYHNLILMTLFAAYP